MGTTGTSTTNETETWIAAGSSTLLSHSLLPIDGVSIQACWSWVGTVTLTVVLCFEAVIWVIRPRSII